MELEDDVQDCREKIYSDQYADYILEIRSDTTVMEQTYQNDCFQLINKNFATIQLKIENERQYSFRRFGYGAVPKCFGLLDTSNMEEAGVLRLRRQPYLDLRGNGVLIGFIDTGIEYTHSVFRNADNTTRIKAIWDQTVQDGTPPEGLLYGQEYTQEMINVALQAENPLELVPTTDENGHGTFMAGIAAGNEELETDFTGAAPLANILMVKLKPAKQNLKNFYGIKEDVICYQENDIMLAIKYLLAKAAEFLQPLIICLGVGTNAGNHDGGLPISIYLNSVSNIVGIAIAIAGGNETNLAHHYAGRIEGEIEEDIELQVGPQENGFTLELWTRAPNLISMGLISPLGEFIGRVPAQFDREQRVQFILESTVIFINYNIIELYTGEQVIVLRFKNPTEGIWRIRIYNETEYLADYNMWLPMREFISPGTRFVNASPNITICEPGNAVLPVTNATYNHANNSIYINSSRGYTSRGNIKPDITAPGVNVYGPTLGNQFGIRTGSSVAAAHVAGG